MRRLTWFSIIALALPAVAIALGGAAWPFELAYHFVGHLMIAAAVVLTVCLFFRQAAPAFAAGLLAAIYGMTAVDWRPGQMSAWAHAAAAEEDGHLGLVSFNLLSDQNDVDPMLDWLATGPADVLVLLEAAPQWRAGFDGLRAAYPYQVVAGPRAAPRETRRRLSAETSGGVAVLSRLPLRAPRVIYPAGPNRPAIVVELDTAGGPVTLSAAHPAKPLSPEGLDRRDRYLAGLGSVLAKTKGPLILAGDFNATRYTPAFRQIQTSLGLSLAPNVPATYPARAGPLGLAIDHVLVRGVRFDRLDPLSALGSDHRGLYARLALPSDHAETP